MNRASFKIFSLILVTISKCDCLSNWLCDFLNDTSVSQISAKCLNQLNTVCQNQHLSWMMFDASSKYPYPGISYGTQEDLGNYPECLSLEYEDTNGRILGKHCGLGLVLIDFLVPNALDKVAQKLNLTELKNNNRILKSSDTCRALEKELKTQDSSTYSMSKLTWCIPDSCTVEEVGYYYLIGYSGLICYTGTDCETVESNTTLETLDIIVIAILSIILLLIIVSTYYDILIHQIKKEPKQKIFIAFSLYTNGKKLFQTNPTNSKHLIQCFDGMRTISMVWIIQGHAMATYPAIPYMNTPDYDSLMNSWRSQFYYSARFGLDTFFFISGFLLAYNYLKIAPKIRPAKQILGLPSLYLYRYLRLTPAVAFLLLVQISINRFFGSGPIWILANKSEVEVCKKQWWEVLLYVQTITHPDSQCLMHTWYLNTDMQMFIVSTLILIPASVFVLKQLKRVIWSFIGLTLIFLAIILALRLGDHSITEYYSFDEYSNYLIGMAIGTLMIMNKDQPFVFSKKQNLIIWTIVLVLMLGCNILYYVDSVNYQYETHFIFDLLYKPVWAIGLAWMVYSCHHGYGGIINGILSLPIFQIGSKLSYCMYLLHPFIIRQHVGSMQVPYYFSEYEAFFNWCAYTILTALLSIIWTLAFEAPMITIEKALFGNGGGKKGQDSGK